MHYFLCTGKWSGLGSIVNSVYWHTMSPRLDGGLHQHFITPRRGLRHHSAVLHWPCYVTTSECRAPCSATSGPAWGMEPCPASSSDRVANTEHINQLSCLHAQSFKFLTCVRFDQALYFLEKGYLWQNSLSKLCLPHTNWKYPVYLGASFMKPFLLHMIILVWFIPCSCIMPQYAPYWLKRFASWVASLLCLPLRSRLFG